MLLEAELRMAVDVVRDAPQCLEPLIDDGEERRLGDGGVSGRHAPSRDDPGELGYTGAVGVELEPIEGAGQAAGLAHGA